MNTDPGTRTTPTAGELNGRLERVSVRDAHRLRRAIGKAKHLRGGAKATALQGIANQIERGSERVGRRRATVPALRFPPELPVTDRLDDLAAAIQGHQVVIVAGETGSGKSTQLPKLCLRLGRGVRGMIGHTQPRRIAARALAERIAEETGTAVGEQIGYAVRFSDHTSPKTLVKLMTDGILLTQIQRDRLLLDYDTIIIDEAHERSLNIDFLLGYLHELLPRRPELKLIITSATIDPQRFSRHFADAPVVEVSGRTYPVEIRYRPWGAVDADGTDGDPAGGDPAGDATTAILGAVDELAREGDGDVLVFLSGEREITDTADALRGHLADPRRPTEVLPLYGRLSAADQHRVFSAHTGRRIVLSTNVAETSLTVPGIRYVIDPGTARISRYSTRSKVQRLPIEKISKASASQRAGRCGRVADGICIRLFSEADFDGRPDFTDPEIARTSLAAVILQMAALDLGDIASFPFIDPPDTKQISDGIRLLDELGAVDKRAGGDGVRLTTTGRTLAALPVDPRLARMLVAADERGCLREMLVIVAALAIQDVREYPLEERDRATAAHARFLDKTSDFLAVLNLWRYLREQAKQRSGNAFRRMCREEYLHYLRIREWQDLHGQLAGMVKGLGMDPKRGTDPAASADPLHTALLAGLLSHVGARLDPGREYQGTRGSKFAIWPGSALAKSRPELVVAAELVETSRLWARTVARIDPAWAEAAGQHLVRRNYSEPRWSSRRSAVEATEKVTLLGVTLVAARTVPYDKVDPELARELFIRHALVEGDWQTRHAFFRANQDTLQEVSELEDRARRRDLRIDDDALFALYDVRIPAAVTSGRHFDAWWKKASRDNPSLLTFNRQMLLDAAKAADIDETAYPDTITTGAVTLDVDYVYDPARADDGVNITIPLTVLARIDAGSFGAPASDRLDLAVALIRSLPKNIRRNLVPAADFASAALAKTAGAPPAHFAGTLAAALTALSGTPVAQGDFDYSKVPDHLRTTFRVVGDEGAVIGSGKDLAALQHQFAERSRSAVAAASGIQRRGLTGFPAEGLPRRVSAHSAGLVAEGFPALADAGTAVDIVVYTSDAEQSAAMRAGTVRLLTLALPVPVGRLRGMLTGEQLLALSTARHGSLAAVLADATEAAVDGLLDWAGGPAWERAGFDRLRSKVAGALQPAVRDVLGAAAQVLAEAGRAAREIDALGRSVPGRVRADLRAELDTLVGAGFIAGTGAARLPDLERYLRALTIRASRVTDNPARDAERSGEIAELAADLDTAVATLPALLQRSETVQAARRLLAEYRIALFAQPMRTAVPVSAKRVRNAIAALTAG